MRRTAWPSAVIGAVVVLLLGGACRSADDAVRDTAGPPPAAAAPPVTLAPEPKVEPVMPAGINVVATANLSKIEIFGAAQSAAPIRTLSNPTETGAPLVFLVGAQQPGWLQVHLPVRPNGSMGWVRAGDVDLTQNNYRIEVELSAFRLTVWKGQEALLSEKVGIGAGATPTPGGTYYIKELLQPPNPNGAYGPYAYGLSGFSEVLTSFGGGPGVLGIHGTNDPSSVGYPISYGCIRMSNASISALAQILPLGVPVEIKA